MKNLSKTNAGLAGGILAASLVACSSMMAATVNVDFGPGNSVLYTGTGPASDTGTSWNNIRPANQGTTFTTSLPLTYSDLTASDGVTATTIDVELTSGFYRAFGGGSATDVQSDRIFPFQNGTATMTLQGLDPATAYHVYLIGGGFTTNFTIDGVTKLASGVDSGDGTWVEGEDYVLYANSTPTAGGELVLTLTSADAGSNQPGVISGLQIVAVPEPSSTLLLGLGGLGFILRRRRA